MAQSDTTNSQLPSSPSTETTSAPNSPPGVGSDRLLGNFISLFDTIEVVACRVAIANEIVDHYRDTSDDIGSFATTLNRWPIKTGFQKSAAATQLIQHLANGPAHERPRWFDTTLGFPLARDVIAEEGMTELARVVRWVEHYKRHFSAQKLGQRWGTGEGGAPEQPGASESNPLQVARIREIGFDRDELIRFLDRNGISHCLHERSRAQSSAGDDPSVPTDARADQEPSSEGMPSTQTVASKSDVETKERGIPTGVIVVLFSRRFSSSQEQERWGKTFSNPAAGLKSARLKSSQGKEAQWDPVEVALWLHEWRGYRVAELDAIFEKHGLEGDRERWANEAARLREKAGFTG